jgi:hypothetical protein
MNEQKHPTEVWAQMLSLSRELSSVHLRLLEVCAILEGLTGIEIIERPRPEPAPRHLQLVPRDGQPVEEAHDMGQAELAEAIGAEPSKGEPS